MKKTIMNKNAIKNGVFFCFKFAFIILKLLKAKLLDSKSLKRCVHTPKYCNLQKKFSYYFQV
jgi:hypothetical protein